MSSLSRGTLYRSANWDQTLSRRCEDSLHASSRVGSRVCGADSNDEEAVDALDPDGPGVEGVLLDVRTRFGGGGLEVDLRRTGGLAGRRGGGDAEGVKSKSTGTRRPLS